MRHFVLDVVVFFFFSSRRRHTRSLRDWSSDVCSSDLGRGCGNRSSSGEALMATEREPIPRRAQRRPIIERIASWSAHHRAVVIFGWLALVIVLVFAGQALGTRQLGNQATPGEAGRAERMLSRAGVSDPISESVLIQDAGGG